MITHTNIILDGLNVSKSICYKVDGQYKESQLIGVMVGDTPKQANYIFSCTGETVAIAFCEVSILSSASYSGFSGNTSIVSLPVYLSKVPTGEQINYKSLTDGLIYETVSDETGAYSFGGVDNTIERVVAWTRLPMTLNAAMAAGITCKPAYVVGDQNIQRIIVQADIPNEKRNCNGCGGTGLVDGSTCGQCGGDGNVENSYPALTISGICPTDVSGVYLSNVSDPEADAETLMNAILISAAPDDSGNYQSETYDGGANAINTWGAYTVWCDSVTSAFTCDMVADYKIKCLSGDTLITMADGTEKRLDKLRPGEYVLSSDLKPTIIRRIARGGFNSYHILYHFSDGTVINETHEHRFFNVEQGFWQKLKNWEIGEHAKRLDGELVELVKVERFEEPAEMFGLWTDSHDYWANSLLSGDADANLPLLAEATAEQAADMALTLEEKIILQIMGLEEIIP